MVQSLGVGGLDAEAGDVRDLRHGWDRRRYAHVEVGSRRIRKTAVPLTVLASEVELLAVEAHHVRVTLGGRGRGGECRQERLIDYILYMSATIFYRQMREGKPS